MRTRKGFTMIELMVVILIVAILAAIMVPIIRGRLDAAKWSEGKAGCGTIATSLRAFCVEKGVDITAVPGLLTTDPVPNLGFLATDLTGKYFINTDYVITKPGGNIYTESTGAFDYLITCTSHTATKPLAPAGGPVTLDENGVWVGP